jgi:copper chaperone
MELKFKTNINCGNCIKAVTPFMEAERAIEEWNVDTSVPEKILTVKGENINAGLIVDTLANAGYTAEIMVN